MTRRSYRVNAEYLGVRYRLAPTNATTSILLRDGLPVGELSADEDRALSAEWTDSEMISSQDVAIGYALAASPYPRRRLKLVGTPHV